jgi:transcription elongation factor Elf1
MRTFECPSCGAAVKFSSGAAVFAVCEHCRSMVVRNDVALEAIGVMATLPPDLSPLQIGTTGTWRDKAFTLLGRVRLAWEQGSWTEWSAEFSDGQRGWLAETQGFFTVSFIGENASHISRSLEAGDTVDLAGRRWRVVDRKKTTCIAAEGELPFVASPGTTRIGLDLAGPNGEFGTLEFNGDKTGGIEFYEGAAAEFAELGFQHLRPVPFWSDQPHEPTREHTRTLNCPTCAAAVSLRAEGLTMSVVCGSCGTILDTAQPEVKIVQQAEATVRDLQPVLPLGRRGELHGVTYEIIGLVVRTDAYASWSEYLLFNPWHGFTWLVTYNGHWSFVRRLLQPATHDGNTAWHNHESFHLYAKGDTQVKAVLGEFYWQTSRGEEAVIEDYIAPPRVLSRETYPGLEEETWSSGEYIEPAVVEKAFALEQPLPRPTGMYLNHPNPYPRKLAAVMPWAIGGLVALIFIHLAFIALRPEREVLSANYTYERAAVEKEFTTPTFKLGGGTRPLGIEAYAPLNNSWIDLETELVNATTGASVPAGIGVSYYSGHDSDGAWSEGERRRTLWLPAVEAGEYFLRIEPVADAALARQPYTVRVLHGGVFHSNLILCAVLLLIYPAWLLWQRHRFEHARWAESDYSPFASSGGDDEDE